MTSTTGPTESGRICLVDVGAMGGLQGKWRPHLDAIAPVLFEPNREEAEKLRAQIPHAIVIEAALSNFVGRRNLMITQNPTCISLRPPNQEFLQAYEIRPHFKVIDVKEVNCTRYDLLHARGTVPRPDIIKMDVQGCEHEALLGFGALLSECVAIEVESHLYPVYREQKLLHELISLLSEFGFVSRWLAQNKISNFDGDIVEVDGFFTKPRSVVQSYDLVQRRKFELITDVWQLPRYSLQSA